MNTSGTRRPGNWQLLEAGAGPERQRLARLSFQSFQKYFGAMSKSSGGFRSWAVSNSNR
jgi:hypothetical protein